MILYLRSRFLIDQGTRSSVTEAQEVAWDAANAVLQGAAVTPFERYKIAIQEAKGEDYFVHRDEFMRKALIRATAAVQDILADPELDDDMRRILLKMFSDDLVSVLKPVRDHFVVALTTRQDLDPWLTHMLLSTIQWNLGWEARGDGFADSVTAEGSQRFHAHLSAARVQALLAWQANPSLPEAAVQMIRVTVPLGGIADESPRFWFDQAVAADFSHMPAYESLEWGLQSRWGGSQEEMLAFGRDCLATERFDTDVPWQFHVLLRRISDENYNLRAIWAEPDVQDEYERMIAGYREVQGEARQAYWDSHLAAMLWLSDRDEEARALLEQLGADVAAAAFETLGTTLADAREDLLEPEVVRQAFAGHQFGIMGAVFSPESGRLITIGDAGAVRTSDFQGDAARDLLPETLGDVRYRAWSRDARLLALSSDFGPVRLIDVERGSILHEYEHDDIQSLAVSGDGERLAVAHGDGLVTIWDTQDHSLVRQLETETSPIQSMALSPDGARCVLTAALEQAGQDAVSLWDIANGEKQMDIGLPGFDPSCINFSNEGSLLALAGSDGRTSSEGEREAILILDVNSGAVLDTFSGDIGYVGDVRFLPDDRRLLSLGIDRRVRIWDVAANQPVSTHFMPGTPSARAGISPDGTRAAIVDDEGRVTVLDLNVLGDRSSVQAHVDEYRTVDGRLFDLQFSRDGNYLATCGWYEGAVLWKMADSFRAEVALPADYPMHAECIALSADARYLVTAGGNTHDDADEPWILLWDVQQRRVLQGFDGHPRSISQVAMSPDGRMFAAGDKSGEVRIWETSTGKLLPFGVLNEHQDGVMAMDFSTDGLMLLTGGADGNFKLWDLPESLSESSSPLVSRVTMGGYQWWVTSLRFLPDGETLLVSAGDVVEVWEVATMTKRYQVPGRYAAVSSDSTRFATAGGVHLPREVRIWDAETGELIRQFQGGHRGEIDKIAWTSNGKLLASAAGGTQIRFWDAETGELVHDPDRAAELAGASSSSPAPIRETADRAVAEWVIGIGGRVDVLTTLAITELDDAAWLPLGTLTLTRIHLVENKSVTDADLSRLNEIEDLQMLSLGGTNVSDDCLPSIARQHRLRDLHLNYTRVTGAGLNQLAGLTALKGLDISGIPLGDVGVEALSKLSSIDAMIVNQTGLTDEQLLTLTAMRNLKHLHVSIGNQVTPEGLQQFQRLLPDCEIH